MVVCDSETGQFDDKQFYWTVMRSFQQIVSFWSRNVIARGKEDSCDRINDIGLLFVFYFCVSVGS